MSIKSALYAKLSTNAGVAALVGTRIFPQVMPQSGVLPAITYRRNDPSSGAREYSHDGPTGRATALFEVTGWAATDTAAQQIADAVVAAVSGASGAWGEVTVQECFVNGERDEIDLDPESRQITACGVTVFCEIAYEE